MLGSLLRSHLRLTTELGTPRLLTAALSALKGLNNTSGPSNNTTPVFVAPGQHLSSMSPAGTLPSHHVADPGFMGARFTNPWDTWHQATWSEVMRWRRQVKKDQVPTEGWLMGNRAPTAEDYSKAFPLHPVDLSAVAAPPLDAIQAFWVGHATVLVQMGGYTFITDPVLSERCAPVQWLGPKRLVAPALTFQEPAEKLPKLDFVLISHNHYDHLDTGSVRRISKLYGPELVWYVPLGLKAWFDSEGVTNVIEMDWWQSLSHKGGKLDVTMVPAQHWTARGVLDRRQTLWGGYIVSSPSQKFYFVGDTGYCPVFKEIGERYGPIDLAAIPIGAYEPRWFMKPQHVNAEEGLQIHKDVRAKTSLAIHCCTFSLTDEPLDEPPMKLAQALKEQGLPSSDFVVTQHGERVVVKGGKLLNSPKLLA